MAKHGTSIRQWIPEDNLSIQAKRINIVDRIASYISVGIQPPFQPNRVTLDIAPRPRVIVPKVVVVQPCIGIEHLPGKAQGDGMFTLEDGQSQ